jgi:hypothetical protein
VPRRLVIAPKKGGAALPFCYYHLWFAQILALGLHPMYRWYRGAIATLLLASSVWLCQMPSQNCVQAQEQKTDPKTEVTKESAQKAREAKQVDIRTVDRVALKGKYYPGDKSSSPCVMLLHALGDSCSNKEWTSLAKKLQEKGYAVLVFDFRGHGDSTSVQPGTFHPNPALSMPGFWTETLNRQWVKGFNAKKLPTEIKYEQFLPPYCTVLANDLAAAKAFLDEQGDCNSSNLILIAANDGATLGALWLNSEFHRFRYLPPAPGLPQGGIDRQNPEGLAVKAAVWLSITPSLGSTKTPLNLLPMLNLAGRVYKVPMLFVYGEGDTKGGDVARKVYETLIPAKAKTDYPFTAALKIAGAEQMNGKNLLLDSLDTTGRILKFLEDVPESKMADKARKNADDTFIWEWIDAAGRPQQAPAKKKGADRLEFAGYASFLR